MKLLKKLCLISSLMLASLTLEGCDKLPSIGINNDEIKYSDDGIYTNDSLKNNGPFTRNLMPSIGDVKVLVVPITFDGYEFKDSKHQNINDVFNSSMLANSFLSVSEYYKLSSYNKLNLSFDIASWYEAKENSYYYEMLGASNQGSRALALEALEALDSTYNFNDYDSDNDGYIDAVWFIYDLPSKDSNSLWWAYSSISDSNPLEFDKKKFMAFGFASTDFIIKKDHISSETLIHETGHLMGLDDYYSYLDSNDRPMEGLDMMDRNIGDHSSFSKILLGWITPIVINKDTTIDIASISSSDEVLLITNKHLTTIYDEYFLVDYFTPYGLNSYHEIFTDLNHNKVSGVRLLHADATINKNSNGTIVRNDGVYQTGFKYDNSDGDKKMLKLIKANLNGNPLIDPTSEYLFNPLSKTFGSEIYNDYKLHTGKAISFTLNVIEMNDTRAKIKIDFKN